MVVDSCPFKFRKVKNIWSYEPSPIEFYACRIMPLQMNSDLCECVGEDK